MREKTELVCVYVCARVYMHEREMRELVIVCVCVCACVLVKKGVVCIALKFFCLRTCMFIS